MDVLNKMKENQRIMIAKIEGVQATQEELVAGQAQIIKMGEATQDLVKKSTSKLCKAVFEATEVSTPTRFVILPYVRARERSRRPATQPSASLGAGCESFHGREEFRGVWRVSPRLTSLLSATGVCELRTHSSSHAGTSCRRPRRS